VNVVETEKVSRGRFEIGQYFQLPKSGACIFVTKNLAFTEGNEMTGRSLAWSPDAVYKTVELTLLVCRGNARHTERTHADDHATLTKKTFDKLPPDLQQIVLKSAQEATSVERSAEAEAGVSAEAEMQGKLGVKFNTIDKEPFKTATKPVIAEFAKTMELTGLLSSIDAVK